MINRAKDFKKYWLSKGYEKGETQRFWFSLLKDVFLQKDSEKQIEFEKQVKLQSTKFIDAYLPLTKVLIEQKSKGVDLLKPIRQSNGEELTPFAQAKKYADDLPYSQKPRWIVTCNFTEFLIYDMEHPKAEPERVLLENFEKEYQKLSFLIDTKQEEIRKEVEISFEAGKIVERLYDSLLKEYIDKTSEKTLHSLNVLCVRLVFCLYAEDTGVFPNRNQFYYYLVNFSPSEMRNALMRLFEILDTPIEERDPYLEEELMAFPYTNGGLFSDKNIEIPRITAEIKKEILTESSFAFDWAKISPTIFGAVFESTLNQQTRRKGGMHYTSIENIHKVIDPLFMDELNERFNKIKSIKDTKKKRSQLLEFQNYLASLSFFDPACGSGNFLTETYLSLRRLENKIIQLLYIDNNGKQLLGDDIIKVSINQFFGIEINDFAVTVATTALWISEAQMLQETEKLIQQPLNFLPLKAYTNITEGNALKIDWQTLFDKTPNYIVGNPPFVGARLMSKEQKGDLLNVFGKDWKNIGNMDYVTAWYKKAVDLIKGTDSSVALVSTNSITQGEQVANLWQPLMKEGVEIDFAYRTFRWDSESNIKAHVHCVVIGFSCKNGEKHKSIYDEENKVISAKNISPYLLDTDNIFIYGRTKPLCKVPEIHIGNQPIDGGNYLFTEQEKEEFVKKEPKSEKYFIKWYGAEEFINNKPRYCLWLGDCSPKGIKDMPLCYKRVKAVRELRLKSSRQSTKKLADKPTRFQVETFPKGSYIIIPRVSSENRAYIPMGFMDNSSIGSDAVHIIPEADLYHFGVLESRVHMAWLRAVCGRLEMRYRYSKDIVYNNFPWPKPSKKYKALIESTAQKILSARLLYKDNSLADLYDSTTMPIELRQAHQENDQAVIKAYGFPPNISEAQIVSKLFEMYANLQAQA